MDQSTTRSCMAVLVTAPASGQGKTTVTAALARAWCNRGLRVQAFKTGPDFIDPTILECATGQPVYQLDLWMGGEDDCRRRLHAAAGEVDLIVIEGVMGLFDGNPSSADLAELFGVPILAVIDASAMAQTFGAIVHGLDRFRGGVRLAGVIANRTGSAGHGDFLAESMPAGIPLWGALRRDQAVELPSRHLGLVLASELDDLDRRLERAAGQLQPLLPEHLAPGVFPAAGDPPSESATRLDGVRIAVAQDAAFCFEYRANLDLLESLGAELEFFSPLADSDLPANVDSLYLPGGYPELHAAGLAANESLKGAVRAFHDDGGAIVAECGGMLWRLDRLTPREEKAYPMVGLLAGEAHMEPRLTALGMQEFELPAGALRGHTFHHARLDSAPEAVGHATNPRGRGAAEAVFRDGSLVASFLHWYFPSNPQAAAQLFRG
ncbi:MAG: cobyrinate a,c-diamide synthase [Halofilum sp. (in: g-proteobacteria)]